MHIKMAYSLVEYADLDDFWKVGENQEAGGMEGEPGKLGEKTQW